MTTSGALGTVERLWRYPTKALAAEALEQIAVSSDGLEGDRRRALFVETRDHARSGKTYRGKEHERLHTVASDVAARALASERRLEVEIRGDGPYFDARPVSLIFDAWIAELEALLGMTLDPLRFRHNVHLRAAPGFALREADFVGKRLALGSTILRCTEPIERCVTPSYDIETGIGDPRVLRAIVQDRDNIVGIYCTVERPGLIACGDELSESG
jgi:uncharacterized protein YcbX